MNENPKILSNKIEDETEKLENKLKQKYAKYKKYKKKLKKKGREKLKKARKRHKLKKQMMKRKLKSAAYLAVTKLTDSQQLQADLDILQVWEHYMELKPSKC